jgi:hypothetical protein
MVIVTGTSAVIADSQVGSISQRGEPMVQTLLRPGEGCGV